MFIFFFFFNDTATTEIYTLSLHDALPIFCFTLCWNEFIYALTFLQSTQNKTVPVAIVNEFVDGDIYRWGSLMAGAPAGSVAPGIPYALFLEHYLSAMTRAGQGKARTGPGSSLHS